MSRNINEIAGDLVEAYKTVRPLENEFVEKVQAYANTVRGFLKEKSWSGINTRFNKFVWNTHITMNMLDVYYDETVVYIDIDCDGSEVPISFEEIENPIPFLEKEYLAYLANEAYHKKKLAEAKKAQIAKLEAELAELSE